MVGTLRKQFKSKTKEWAEATSFHGLRNISSSGYLAVKLIWSVLFIGALGYSIHLISNSFTAYFSYDVVSSVSIIKHPQIDFPTVTICNFNVFDMRKNSNLTTYADKFVKDLNQNRSLKYTGILNHFLQVAESYYKTSIYNNLSDIELGFKMSDMLMSCQFNAQPCNSSDFTLFETFNYGNCYQFNAIKKSSDSKKQTQNGGLVYGLNLELFLGNTGNELNILKSNGVRVYVHDSKINPIILKEGFYVSPGTETNMVISQTNFNRIKTSVKNCIENVTSTTEFDSDFYRETIRKFKIYSQKYCVLVCYNQFIFEKCNASITDLNNFQMNRNLDLNATICFTTKTVDFYSNSSLVSNCYSKCPQECDTVNYDLQISFADYPTQFYSTLIKSYFAYWNNYYPRIFYNFTDHAELKKNILAINLYFQDTSYMLIEENLAKTPEQLIADIGGLLGLWVGASLLSIIEVFELALELFILFIQRHTILRVSNSFQTNRCE